MLIKTVLKVLIAGMLFTVSSLSQDAPEPGEERTASIKKFPTVASPRENHLSKGPFNRLVIRGATLVDGTGAPPIGPVDIVIEGNRISEIRSVGNPGVPIREEGRPAAGDHEIDAHGSYVLPGFIDAHSHIGNAL